MAMASNGVQLEMDTAEWAKCPICMERLREPRRAPDCGHYLCANCLDTLQMSTSFEHVHALQAYARVRTFACPACGALNRIAGEARPTRRPENHTNTPAQLVAAAETRCSIHTQRQDNVMFCEDCSTFCCSEQCVLQHPRHLLRRVVRLTNTNNLARSPPSAQINVLTSRLDAGRVKDSLQAVVDDLKSLLDDFARSAFARISHAAARLGALRNHNPTSPESSSPTPYLSVAQTPLLHARTQLERLLADHAGRPVSAGYVATPRNNRPILAAQHLLAAAGTPNVHASWLVRAVHAAYGHVYVSLSAGKLHCVLQTPFPLPTAHDPNAKPPSPQPQNTRLLCRLPHPCVAIHAHAHLLLFCLSTCSVVSFDLQSSTPSTVPLPHGKNPSPSGCNSTVRAFILHLRSAARLAVCFQHDCVLHLLHTAPVLQPAECLLLPDVTALAYDHVANVCALATNDRLLLCDDRLRLVVSPSPPARAANNWHPTDVLSCDVGVFFVLDANESLHCYNPAGQYLAMLGDWSHSVCHMISLPLPDARADEKESESKAYIVFWDDADKLLKHTTVATGFTC